MARYTLIERHPFNIDRNCVRERKLNYGLSWTSVVLANIDVSWVKY
jgi:hypothetical protein